MQKVTSLAGARLVVGASALALLSPVWSSVPAIAQQAAQPVAPPAAPPAAPASPAAPKPPAAADAAAKDAAAKDAAAPSATPEAAVAVITVTGEKPANQIDREVYDPKTDPDTPTSNIADALNKAPGVNVDPEGNVSLRGNSSVQVLIDGRRSAMMQGEMRAATLQSLSAEDIDSIEVMTNPSAEFSAEGSGGVINIVMKRTRRPGKTLGVNLGLGTEGRKNGNLSAALSTSDYTLTGGLFGRHEPNSTESDSVRTRTGSTGAQTVSNTTGQGRNVRDARGFNAGIDYNLGDADTLGAQLRLFNGENSGDQYSTIVDSSTAGVVSRAYVRRQTQSGDRTNGEAKVTLDHTGDTPGEKLKGELRWSGSEDFDDRLTLQTFTLGGSDSIAQQVRESTESRFGGSLSYNRRFGDSLLSTGFQIDSSASEFDNAYVDINPVTGVRTANASRSNLFEVDQNQYEAYGTLQWLITDKLTVLPGVRVELTEVDLLSVTQSIAADNSYTRVHPSLHVTYQLTDASKLNFAYTNRVRRPGANDLNPFIVYRDERTASSGNPDLEPQSTQGVEAGYEYKVGRGGGVTVRAFHRQDEDTFIEQSVFLPDGVLLTTRANGGEGSQTGLELAFNGKLHETFNVDLRSTLSRNEITTVRSGVRTTSEADAIQGRMMLNYRPNDADQFQLMANAQGKQLTGEGYVKPVYTADLSYRRRFSNKVSINLAVRDLFESSERQRVVDTPTLQEVSSSISGGRTFTIGISYTPFAREGRPQADEPPRDRGPRGDGPPRGPGGFGGGPPPF